MASFTLDDGMATSASSRICALRMRVSMSAMGSLMLMQSPLPAGLDDAGDLAAHREFAQLVAAEAELAEHPTRTARDRAAVAHAGRVRVARQLLNLLARGEAVLV